MVNAEMLTEAIKDSGLKKASIIEKMGISYSSLQRKISGRTEFKASEIGILKEILGLDDASTRVIFYH